MTAGAETLVGGPVEQALTPRKIFNDLCYDQRLNHKNHDLSDAQQTPKLDIARILMGEILASNFLPKLSPKPHPRKPKQKTPSLEAMQTSASTVGKGGGIDHPLKKKCVFMRCRRV